jgi:UDP-N-acetylglucosamine acyltransferase
MDSLLENSLGLGWVCAEQGIATMNCAASARVHPTALISEEAIIGENVVIGPYVVIEGPVVIGDNCNIRAHAILKGPLEMGPGNQVYSGAVLGEDPQHIKYQGEATQVIIGRDNIFREHVTIHRGTTSSWKTVIGDNNFLMAYSHIAHDCIIGNRCILANGAQVGGHCEVADNVFLSGNSCLHQFVRVGRFALLSGCSASTKDMPPFMVQQGINIVHGVNLVGMRRAGIAPASIDAIRKCYHHLYREGLSIPVSCAKMEATLGHIPEVRELIEFIRVGNRGISLTTERAAA